MSDTSTEAQMRDLVRAKVRAWNAYQASLLTNTVGKSEDEIVDLEIESRRLYQLWQVATLALVRFEDAIKSEAA